MLRFESKRIELYCNRRTGKVYRHPVVASDGNHYELEDLLTYVKCGEVISPFTYEPLTFATYDLQLKNEIGRETENEIVQEIDTNRYPDYDKEAALEELILLLGKPYTPQKQSFYLSNVTAYTLIFSLASDACLQNIEFSPSSLLSIVSLSVSADYLFRMGTGYQFGLFEGARRFLNESAKQVVDFYQFLGEIDPDEYESVLRL